MNQDERRTAALHLWPDRLDEREGRGGARVRRGLAPRFPTPQPLRFVQALEARRRGDVWEQRVVEPVSAYRADLLGDAAVGPPRALVRVDEFPHARAFDPEGPFGTEAYLRFHEVLRDAEIPYLLAITPHVSRHYLDPEVAERRDLVQAEVAALRALREDGVVFGLHGVDHRTRHASPRRHSELCGLSPQATAARIDGGRAILDRLDLPTPAFVPPFNRFDFAQYPLLAERFEIVCGGPESIRLLGFQPTPVWHGEAVYLPSYAPLYGTAAEAAGGIEALAERRAGLWAPITLHWGWELEDGFTALRRLCRSLRGRVAAWEEFLTAVGTCRPTTAEPSAG